MDETKTIKIPCCVCAAPIKPNLRNMCAMCLHKYEDITEAISKQAVLHFCRNCERYLQPPGEWISAALGSRELLAICLNKCKGMKDLNLVDASFLWTESHCKRIILDVVVHREITAGIALKKSCLVEFTVQNRMCNDCHRIEAKDFWQCLVQVRQHAGNKKTFYYLEQLILKHKAHEHTLGIKPKHGGLDFYYANENHARKLVDFLQALVSVKVTTSKRLLSHDMRSNVFNYKYTWSVEIAPVSKDSAVCLNQKLRQQLGNLSAICLIHKVAGGIHLIDPLTAQISELSGQAYFRTPFEAICDPKQLVEYIVMDVENIKEKERKLCPGRRQISSSHVLCDVWIVRASKLGIKEDTIHTRSHLGHLLNVGDSVLGYNLAEANVNNLEFEKLHADQIPDVILVRKCFSDRQTRSSQRAWKLKHLAEEATDERSKHDFHEFLEDLEEDVEYRKQVNIYRDANKVHAAGSDALSDNVPRIELAEMLQDVSLNSVS